MTTRTVSKWLFGIEGANVRIGRAPTQRNVGIVEIGRCKLLAVAQAKALRRFAKTYRTNEIALKVVSIKKVTGQKVESFLDVYGEAERVRTTQPIEQVIYDSAKSTDAFSYSTKPQPTFTPFTIGNMTLKVRNE